MCPQFDGKKVESPEGGKKSEFTTVRVKVSIRVRAFGRLNVSKT